jgi:hypothetical protein
MWVTLLASCGCRKFRRCDSTIMSQRLDPCGPQSGETPHLEPASQRPRHFVMTFSLVDFTFHSLASKLKGRHRDILDNSLSPYAKVLYLLQLMSQYWYGVLLSVGLAWIHHYKVIQDISLSSNSSILCLLIPCSSPHTHTYISKHLESTDPFTISIVLTFLECLTVQSYSM